MIFGIIFATMFLRVASEKPNTLCYGRPTYITRHPRPYTCHLWQPNWAIETAFELHFLHCQKMPTVSLFIRNFYGYDEINTYLNPKYKSFKTRLYTGVLARIDLKFTIIKENKKLNIRPSVEVKVLLVPDHKFSPDKRFMLLAVFYTDMKDDCNFFDTMELHTKVIIALVLIAVLVIIPIIVALIRKWKKERGTGNRKKTFCAWFFKCEPNYAQEHLMNNDHMLNEMRDMNGGATNGRLLY